MKPKKLVSIAVVVFALMFLTVGIPQNIVEPTWYSVWSIKGWEAIVAAIAFIVIIGFFVAQFINEYNRPNKNQGGKDGK